jgi:hypothetical protein
MITLMSPNKEITKSDVVVYDLVTHFISAVHSNSHFAVLLCDIEARNVVVYYGPLCHLQKWVPHIRFTLRKYEFQIYKT